MNLKHSVHFLLCPHTPLNAPLGRSTFRNIDTPIMIELLLTRVQFVVDSSIDVYDVQFSNGTLQLPIFFVHIRTKKLIRNMMAFEHSYCKKHYLIGYILFIHWLIRTSNDVNLLMEHGIVGCVQPNNSEVVILINNLSYGIKLFEDSHFVTICDSLKRHCKKTWIKWKVLLKQCYLKKPLAIFNVYIFSLSCHCTNNGFRYVS